MSGSFGAASLGGKVMLSVSWPRAFEAPRKEAECHGVPNRCLPACTWHW